ncbi:MAG: lipopolysaccharide transport periplasmic protein LptA [Geobacter sp.]|nr:MAG: lipopolysaccharide transport periplasmic protein LptA [Geobacter sp.]
MNIFKIIILVIFMSCLAVPMLLAATDVKTQSKDRSTQPISIKSNEMSADNKGKTAVFSGNVVAKQGDITIYADKLTISYAEGKKDVEKIEADGNVRIVHENRLGTAAHAVYDSRLGRITLTGNPKVMQGDDTISANIITYIIDEDKSVASGQGSPNKRVEVIIQQPARKGNAGPR